MKRLSPTRRLYIKVIELKEQMERLVAHDGTPEAIVKLSRVERRYWPLQGELLRRMDERDALVASRNMNKTRTFTDEGGRFMTITGKWGI